MLLLDTNICIYIMKQRDMKLIDRLEAQADHVVMSSIVLAELQLGVAGSNRRMESMANLHKFLKPLKPAAFDAAAARYYGEIEFFLRKQGTPIGVMDTLIAAHALSLAATVVTNNAREFERVPGLKVENWVQ